MKLLFVSKSDEKAERALTECSSIWPRGQFEDARFHAHVESKWLWG